MFISIYVKPQQPFRNACQRTTKQTESFKVKGVMFKQRLLRLNAASLEMTIGSNGASGRNANK